MKAKKLSLLAGAIALTLTAIPFAAQAQRGVGSHFNVAQATNGQTPRKGPWAELGLTDTQKSQIQAIQRDSRNKIEQIILSKVNLTQEQKDKLNELKAQRGQRQAGEQRGQRGKKGGFAALNLTEEQKTQLKQAMQSAEVKQIMQSSQQQIQAILTPEQQQKLQQLRQNARARWQQRQQRNPNQGTQP
ncbi:hypothetical protein NIES2100_16350 [Calothrix sp. NIES-2100]|uniref:P pilus assembly/Cpx signaling pathway, periplasmic inhibitor/zinc-resistance associated protein n=1 Tax=Calothrix sp. NIES-2100 TaxID=1954172 RepID=UPI000B5E8C7F|nr:hypothetical protein NIES2100_16350 [Calothrix sp. NIES-2100]